MSVVRDDQGKPVALLLSPTSQEAVTRFRRGDRVRAFAWWLWQKTGDVGDNSQFYLPATVLRFYFRPGDGYLADLLFDCGRESRGHFARGLRRIGRVLIPHERGPEE